MSGFQCMQSMFNSAVAPQRETSFVPRLRLFTETVFVEGERGVPEEEFEAGVLSLRFDYPRGAPADPAGERNARYLLESFGVTELECLDSCVVAPGSPADYLIQTSCDVQRLCEFMAYALPQLRELGWQVDIDEQHRWQVVSDSSWFVDVAADPDKPDWFGLQMGIDLEGERINLLPALVEMLEAGTSLNRLVRPGRKCLVVHVGDCRYVTVSADRLRRVVEVLSELYTDSGSPILHRTALAALGRFDDSIEDLEWHGDDSIRQSARALVTEIPDIEAPHELQATLRPYQREGFAWLQNLRAHGAGAVLADDMGLGKTLQTIAHIVAEKAAGRATAPSLIVAPTSLVGNWQRELRKFAPHLAIVILHGPQRHSRWSDVVYADVVITTYPILVRDLELFKQREFYIAALDEAQTIKNPGSQAHKAACALSACQRLCLSGTPVENNLGELWSLFHFAMPNFLGSARKFRNDYRIPIEKYGVEERLSGLRTKVSPFILRRTKNEVAKELPPKTEIVRAVELSGQQRDLYESIRMSAHARVRKTIKKSGIAGSTIAILDALMKLRQVCCDPRLLNMSSAQTVTESAKYQLLMQLLDLQLAEGRRALIFSQFTSMLELIGQGLRERGIHYLKLTGSTSNRQEKVDQFESGRADVFLISLKAGGTGLNLTSADTVIHYDPWWNPAAQAQATDRAYRIGQTKPVFVYNLIAAGSVEEKMLHLQRRKRQLADSILSAGGKELDQDDLDNLFEPLG